MPVDHRRRRELVLVEEAVELVQQLVRSVRRLGIEAPGARVSDVERGDDAAEAAAEELLGSECRPWSSSDTLSRLTPRRFASSPWVMWSAGSTSSRSTSPGWVGFRFVLRIATPPP